MLVHSGERILPELSPELGEYARQKLEARGVESPADPEYAVSVNESSTRLPSPLAPLGVVTVSGAPAWPVAMLMVTTPSVRPVVMGYF